MIKKENLSIIILVVILSLFIILDILEIINIPCVFNSVFHIYCPGCGTTRMIRSLLHFEFYQAFRYNPLIFILLFAFLGVFISEILYYMKNKKLFNISTKIYIFLIIILIIYGIMRNIPFFSWLAPTVIK